MSKIPIFIVGINPRSGTNYLYNLLAIHPECTFSNHTGEDFIIYGLDKYLTFFDKVTHQWKKDWNNNRADFKKALEFGLIKYLDPIGIPGKYMISKTPSPSNVDLFLKVFSKGYLIIIIRNGQDVTESFTVSLKGRFDDVVRTWKRGAKSIYDLMQDENIMNSGRIAIIKYEDLYTDNERVMKKLLDLLHLDKSKFDFERSRNFDVIGSSAYKGLVKDLWEPIPKEAGFNPLHRSANWSRWDHYRFNWLAGKYSKALNYELFYESKNPVYFIYNLTLTFYNYIYRVFRRVGIILSAIGKSKKEMRRAFEFEIK